MSTHVDFYVSDLDVTVTSQQHTVIDPNSMPYTGTYDYLATGTISTATLNNNLIFFADQQNVQVESEIDTGFYVCNFAHVDPSINFVSGVEVTTLNPTGTHNLGNIGDLPNMMSSLFDNYLKVSESYSYTVAAHLFNRYTAVDLFNNTLSVEHGLDSSLNQLFLDAFQNIGSNFATGSTDVILGTQVNPDTYPMTKSHTCLGYKIMQAILNTNPDRYKDMTNFALLKNDDSTPDWIKNAKEGETNDSILCSINQVETPGYAFQIGLKADDVITFKLVIHTSEMVGLDLNLPGNLTPVNIPDTVYLVKLTCV